MHKERRTIPSPSSISVEDEGPLFEKILLVWRLVPFAGFACCCYALCLVYPEAKEIRTAILLDQGLWGVCGVLSILAFRHSRKFGAGAVLYTVANLFTWATLLSSTLIFMHWAFARWLRQHSPVLLWTTWYLPMFV